MLSGFEAARLHECVLSCHCVRSCLIVFLASLFLFWEKPSLEKTKDRELGVS